MVANVKAKGHVTIAPDCTNNDRRNVRVRVLFLYHQVWRARVILYKTLYTVICMIGECEVFQSLTVERRVINRNRSNICEAVRRDLNRLVNGSKRWTEYREST